MALTAAERTRRSRRHRAGDHTLCDPKRCHDAVTAVTPQVSGTRGERLYAELTADGRLGPAERVLAEEAGRLADRLDQLHEFLAGRGRHWLRFDVADAVGDEALEVVVKVDGPLGEARQHALALKQLAAELRASGAARRPAAGPPGPPTSMPASGTGGAGGLGDLAAKFAEAARRRAAAG